MCPPPPPPPWQRLSEDLCGDVRGLRRGERAAAAAGSNVRKVGGLVRWMEGDWLGVCHDAWPPAALDMTERMAECRLNCSACHVCHAQWYRKSCFWVHSQQLKHYLYFSSSGEKRESEGHLPQRAARNFLLGFSLSFHGSNVSLDWKRETNKPKHQNFKAEIKLWSGERRFIRFVHFHAKC